jgi:hypothetical protein
MENEFGRKVLRSANQVEVSRNRFQTRRLSVVPISNSQFSRCFRILGRTALFPQKKGNHVFFLRHETGIIY